MSAIFSIILSFVFLLFIALGVLAVSRKTRFPYTVLLVLVGLVLVPISHISFFSFINSFELTPDLLFLVFLPTLIFESAYNMNARKMIENIRSISILSICSLIISTLFIAIAFYYGSLLLGFPLPFIVTLLFGALISATDPVAVLALFKEYGAPKRLALIFEGESLFNDGTAFALFLIILEILSTGWMGISSIAEGIFMFTTMVLGGVLFGGLMGILFSKLIERIHNNEHIEITLTMIVAHLTFLLSEIISHSLTIFGHPIHLSAIIATVVAAMVVGNYGRYKISPRVAEYMEKFWGYFAFVVNSIVFILIGLLFDSLPVSFNSIIVPLVVAVIVVIIGRAVSVYPVIALLNWTKKEEHIPFSWQHLMAWGSLRGALAITMVLLIPDTLTLPNWPYADISIKDFITALTIACIYFTLFIKATTIGPIIRKLKIDALSPVEATEFEEGKALIYAKVLLEIDRFQKKGYITNGVYEQLRTKYELQYKEACQTCKTAMLSGAGIPEKMLTLYALGIARHSLKTLFFYREVTEKMYRKILREIELVEEKTEQQVPTSNEAKKVLAFFEKTLDAVSRVTRSDQDGTFHVRTQYMYHRAQLIIAQKVIEELVKLSESNIQIFEGTLIFEQIILTYTNTQKKHNESIRELRKKYPDITSSLALEFAEAGICKAEEKILNELRDKDILPPKIAIAIEDALMCGK